MFEDAGIEMVSPCGLWDNAAMEVLRLRCMLRCWDVAHARATCVVTWGRGAWTRDGRDRDSSKRGVHFVDSTWYTVPSSDLQIVDSTVDSFQIVDFVCGSSFANRRLYSCYNSS